MQQTIPEQMTALNQLFKKQDLLYHNFALFLGLSDSELWVLYAVWESGESASQYDLCNAWFYPKQTINSAVSSLAKKKYVFLQRHPGSRTRKTIVLTETGVIFCKKAIIPLMEAEKKAFAQLSEEERIQFLSLSQSMLSMLQLEIKAIEG